MSVNYSATELLAHVSLQDGRRQTVKLASISVNHGGQEVYVLRFQSRACVARSAKTIQSALKRNAENQIYGLALDGSTNPPTIDLLFHSILDSQDINDITVTIHQIAAAADAIEKRAGTLDVF